MTHNPIFSTLTINVHMDREVYNRLNDIALEDISDRLDRAFDVIRDFAAIQVASVSAHIEIEA